MEAEIKKKKDWNDSLSIEHKEEIEVRIIYFYYLFFHRRPTLRLCFLFCKPFVVNATFSTGLIVSSVSWLGQLTVGV